jgi:hypoxanthine phosphoribosyltransferase
VTDVVSVLFAREDIRRRIEELGREITGDYDGREPVLVSVLRGGSVFLADLIREISLPVGIDFMSISRYGGAAESMGRVRIVKDLEDDIGGRDVIVVEDIVDTGLTLSYLLGVLESRSPASLAVCALLDKTARRIAPLAVRYRGFECPDVFVVGYGLDLHERYRNLPELVAVQDIRALESDRTPLDGFLPRRRPVGDAAAADG